MPRSVGRPRTVFAKTDITTPGSGLFRIAEKGKSKLEATEVIVMHDGIEITYSATYRLGAEEWRVFLAVAALAALDGRRGNGPQRLPGLWDKFITVGAATERDALEFQTTAYALLREIGLADSGQNRKALSKCLERLSSVNQTMRKGNRVVSGARFLGFAHDEDSGELRIGISPQMARAILGESKQFVRISLVETRKLENAAAVLLQAHFSRWVRPGKTGRFMLDDLCRIVYGPANVLASTFRTQRLTVRRAILAFADWSTWQIGLDERVDSRGVKVWSVQVHRVSQAELLRWEAETLAEETALQQGTLEEGDGINVTLDAENE